MRRQLFLFATALPIGSSPFISGNLKAVEIDCTSMKIKIAKAIDRDEN